MKGVALPCLNFHIYRHKNKYEKRLPNHIMVTQKTQHFLTSNFVFLGNPNRIQNAVCCRCRVSLVGSRAEEETDIKM